MKRKHILLWLALGLTACSNGESSVVVTPTLQTPFAEPDVHVDFCGREIDQNYCDCAFENTGCSTLGVTKEEANAEVASKYGVFVAKQLRAYSTECAEHNGYVDNKTCHVCPELSKPQDQQCVMELHKDDEVTYHVTSDDKLATLRIPEEALPRNIDILEISVVKTSNGYSVLPANLTFGKNVTLTVTDERGQTTVTDVTSSST